MGRARDFADLASAYSEDALSSRNLIDNGAMNVYQRGSAVLTGNGGAYSLDRWNVYQFGGGHLTVTKDAEVPSGKGFLSSMKLDVTQAESSMSAGDIYVIRHGIEGQNLQNLCKGTSDAKPLTLQFWVRSPKTGVHVALLLDEANSRWCSQSYTIASADTWQYVTVTFPADTTGALANNNTGALSLRFFLGAGSNFSGGGNLGTTWNTTANLQAVGQVNVLDNTANNFYLTGVQLELGEVSTPFEHEDFDTTLQKCRRYYQTCLPHGSVPSTSTSYDGTVITTSWTDGNCPFPNPFTPMRSAPTVTLRGRGSTTTGQIQNGGTYRAATATNVTSSSISYIAVTSGTDGQYNAMTYELNSEIF